MTLTPDQQKTALRLLENLCENTCSYFSSEPCGEQPIRRDGRHQCFYCEARAFLKRVKATP